MFVSEMNEKQKKQKMEKVAEQIIKKNGKPSLSVIPWGQPFIISVCYRDKMRGKQIIHKWKVNTDKNADENEIKSTRSC